MSGIVEVSGQGPDVALSSVPRPSSAGSVAPACVALYLVVVVGLLFAILHRNDGVFTYTLDDPYIHLALAENLIHGHYGINPGEPSSPSSSIVWPFLLTPTAAHPWNQYLPFAWNMLFCGLAAWLIGRIVDRWSWPPRPTSSGVGATAAGWLGWFGRFSIAVTLMLVANLAGLPFLGMEHGLQVLLAVICAAGFADSLGGRPISTWCLWAAALGPLVRYENFALVAAVMLALWGEGRLRTAVRLAVASLVGPALFSLFLISRGLPAVPSSVLVKANAYALAGDGTLSTLHTMYLATLGEYAWWAQFVVAAILFYLTVRERQRARRFLLGGALLAALLQLAVGRVNWFHRYEVYALIFTTLVTATELARKAKLRFDPMLALFLVLSGLAVPYMFAIQETPRGAANIYQQQYQMHRFLAGFFRGTVAVNDLGWVSYRRPPGVTILDLWGLASPEASRTPDKDADWLDTITRAHSAGLAIVYPEWYEEGAPDDWDPLATMCITSARITAGRPCVVFYSTEVGNKALLTAQIAAFARTLPPSVNMTLGRDSSDQRN